MTVLLESLEQMILVGINQQLRYTIHQTIVMTMIVPNLGIMYQTLHSNVLLFRRLYTNMIQDVVLDLECDKNQYALRGHTSNKSTFTMMIHISYTQQCDYMHNSTEHTTDTIRINTVGTCDNGDGTVTIKDGERSSNVIPSSINSTICTSSNGRYNPSTNMQSFANRESRRLSIRHNIR